MTLAIVQAQCPSCQNVLNIPASWVDQPMRCKCCGRVFQMQASPSVAPEAPPLPMVAQPTQATIPLAPPPAPTLPPEPPADPLIYFDAHASRRRRRVQSVLKIVLLFG